jgi:hypothetical protein
VGRLHQVAERRGQAGKLIRAARLWLGLDAAAAPRALSPDPAALAALAGGADAAAARRVDKAAEGGISPQRIPLWRGHWPVFELATMSISALRRPPLGGLPLGWDWPQAQSMAAGLGVPWDRATICGLQDMEAVILEAAAKRAKK